MQRPTVLSASFNHRLTNRKINNNNNIMSRSSLLSVCLVLGVLAAVANAESAAVASAPRDKRQILGAILGSLLGGGGHGHGGHGGEHHSGGHGYEGGHGHGGYGGHGHGGGHGYEGGHGHGGYGGHGGHYGGYNQGYYGGGHHHH
ncbi:cold and drought-regulated protein CORA-like isoform X2 [Daphnia pulicaria]|uniref:cold and drought-regulated protein CORA-like isoform X2 n=1 Tax=Daphnia pulicaria TaxID=35523 RepID=UPI001EEBC40F|nr:cold and drought-regulated protein CORA-like isoform X2 [Daphnia pulicaria]